MKYSCKKITNTTDIDKNGAYGISFAFFIILIGTAIKSPKKGAIKNTTIPNFQPIIPPDIHINLTSPIPIASFLKIYLPAIAVIKTMPPETDMPKRDDKNEYKRLD